MRVALVFPHDPRARPPGVDLVRLLALGTGLRAQGVEAEIVAPVTRPARLGRLPLLPLDALAEPRAFDLVKTCYHQAVPLAARFSGPLVARLVRVVDARRPARDRRQRDRLLEAQALLAQRAQAVALNNPENLRRWERLYGHGQIGVIAPTGCPARLPALGPDPFPPGPPVVVYAGSLASPRQVDTLNRLAAALEGRAGIHLVGRNKSGLYGRPRPLSSLVSDQGEKPPRAVWDYLRHAALGLALAVGPEPFDNDSSKVAHYLRAGLPVVCERPILQGPLVTGLGMGLVAPYNRVQDLAQAVKDMLRRPPAPDVMARARAHMARDFAWGRTVQVYLDLFSRLLGQGGGR